ncbi:MAG: hypothetical protein KZQ73_05495 [Candidatus Thiodiazotropha sp. (ex Semelilucina semeliformis)]|nr:hypothetical protein [Candidatus Thiodiazotropha sp. (ex Semelilucina semeliformis)]
MNKKRIAQLISFGEVLVALPLYGIYTAPIRYFGAIGYWTPMNILTNVLSVVFLVLPLLALYGVSKDRSYGYWSLGLFPVVAFVFGVTAIPFVKYLYGNDVMLNTVFIVLINVLVTAAAIWLYYSDGLRSGNTGQSEPPPV